MNIIPGKLFVLDKRCILIYSVENEQVRFVEYSKDDPSEKVYRIWSVELLSKMLEKLNN